MIGGIIVRMCSIASGSSGNCVYVGNDKTNIIIDAGISGKRMEAGLSSIGVEPASLDGIFVTHEHLDHVSGLGVMARRYEIPIYATVETIHAILRIKSIGKIKTDLFRMVEADSPIEVKDMRLIPFSISHDASNPVCYTIYSNDHKVGIATDLGKYDDYIISNLKGCEMLLLEANHDINMLEVGSYPYILKRRILGERGHLSNDNSGRLIDCLLTSQLKYVFLGHLSKENNYPELAYETVKYELEETKNPYREQCRIMVANRDEPSMLVSV